MFRNLRADPPGDERCTAERVRARPQTRTNSITRMSTFLTRKAVTEELQGSFRRELSSLGFRHVEVELEEVGGAEGVLYHRLVLARAPGVELPKVVSEGEQRCLAIASFFAELSTADDRSAIVFDDPVSSLDYKWRDGVARRLVEEAKTRQVIVFTHDVVFLLRLKELADEEEVEQLDRYVRNLPGGAGVCAEELPWVALKVSSRVANAAGESPLSVGRLQVEGQIRCTVVAGGAASAVLACDGSNSTGGSRTHGKLLWKSSFVTFPKCCDPWVVRSGSRCCGRV